MENLKWTSSCDLPGLQQTSLDSLVEIPSRGTITSPTKREKENHRLKSAFQRGY